MRRWLAAVPMLILMAGCSTGSTVRLGNRTVTPADVHETNRVNRARVSSLYGEGRLSIETPEGAQSGSFRLRLVQPDSLGIEIQGPFGIRVGSGLITRGSFLFFNALQNQAVSGSTTPETMRRIFQLPLSFDEILSIVSGGSFTSEDEREPDEARVEQEQVVYEYRHASETTTYWIDPDSRTIRRIVRRDRRNRPILDQMFSDFSNTAAPWIPLSIRIIQPRERNLILLTFGSTEINTRPPAIPVTIPQNAELVRLP